MITQWFMEFLHSLATTLSDWMRGVLPAPPTWVSDLTSGVDTVLGMVPHALRYFVPLGPTVAIGLTLASLFLVAGGIRFARRVLSIFTGGGGNA